MINQPITTSSKGTDWSVLEDIRLDAKNIVVVPRSVSHLEQQLAQLIAYGIEFRGKGSKLEILQSLREYMATNYQGMDVLIDDIALLFDKFEAITEANTFQVLLTIVNTDMCRRFHTDINYLRMLCTYKGQGTLWLPEEAVNWDAYHAKSGNEQIVKDERLIQQANAGDVLILKGALYPNGKAVIHRSPTIEAAGEERLLLRIDTNEFLNALS